MISPAVTASVAGKCPWETDIINAEPQDHKPRANAAALQR
jgi:hypothetical protein